MPPATNQGIRLGKLFYDELERRLTEAPRDVTAAEFELIRKVLESNSITLGMVQSGKFGEIAKEVAEKFPFEDDGEPTYLPN